MSVVEDGAGFYGGGSADDRAADGGRPGRRPRPTTRTAPLSVRTTRTVSAGRVRSTRPRTPVTNFTVDADLYNANSESDRDGDGIACEQH